MSSSWRKIKMRFFQHDFYPLEIFELMCFMSFNRLFIALSENIQFICQKVISFDLNRLKVV